MNNSIELNFIAKTLENINDNLSGICPFDVSNKLDDIDGRLADLVDAINNLADIIGER